MEIVGLILRKSESSKDSAIPQLAQHVSVSESEPQIRWHPNIRGYASPKNESRISVRTTRPLMIVCQIPNFSNEETASNLEASWATGIESGTLRHAKAFTHAQRY